MGDDCGEEGRVGISSAWGAGLLLGRERGLEVGQVNQKHVIEPLPPVLHSQTLACFLPQQVGTMLQRHRALLTNCCCPAPGHTEFWQARYPTSSPLTATSRYSVWAMAAPSARLAPASLMWSGRPAERASLGPSPPASAARSS